VIIQQHFLLPNIGQTAIDWSSPSRTWSTALQAYQPFYLFLAFYTSIIASNVLAGFAFIVVEQRRWFERWRIHKDAYNTFADYWKCTQNILLTYAFLIFPILVPGWVFLHEHSGMDFSERGFPTLAVFLWHLLLCWLGEDFFQYFFHRLLHIPWLYKNVHKKHHEFQAPFALAGNYAHPVEVMFLAMCTFLPAIILRPHFFTFLIWIYARQMDAVLEHCGYLFPNPLHHLPFYGGIAFHDYHHTGFTTNYASRFTYLDRLLGTYKEPPPDYGAAKERNDDAAKQD